MHGVAWNAQGCRARLTQNALRGPVCWLLPLRVGDRQCEYEADVAIALQWLKSAIFGGAFCN
jgi:hypothetical protein